LTLYGRGVTIRSMRREDVDEMMRWRPTVDPEYQPFDFPQRSRPEHYAWFTDRANDPSRRLYTIEDQTGQIIGSLTLREIDGHRSARLGITLGADFLSRGLGTDALRTFLHYFFGSMDFFRMDLDVATTNRRAIRCYRSLGFREVGHHWEAAIHPSYRILVQDARYKHLLSCFRRLGTALEVKFLDMALTTSEWQEHGA
jgi:diamine N-acetyltransferase